MNEEKRALLGDHEAAKRLTDAGVLVPCPMCGGMIVDVLQVDSQGMERRRYADKGGTVQCKMGEMICPHSPRRTSRV